MEASAPISEVMYELKCSRRTAQHLMKLGRLEQDEVASDSLKMVMVSRASLERLKFERDGRKTLPQSPPEGTVPLLEAQTRTGLDRIGVLQLKAAGVVIFRISPD